MKFAPSSPFYKQIYSPLYSPTTNSTEWAAQKRTGYNRISLLFQLILKVQILCRFYVEPPTVISYPTSFLGVVSHVRIKFLQPINNFIRAEKNCFKILLFYKKILVKISFWEFVWQANGCHMAAHHSFTMPIILEFTPGVLSKYGMNLHGNSPTFILH